MTPSTKCSCSGSPPMLANGRTTMRDAAGRIFPRAGRRGLRVRGLADVERIDPDRLGDVLELYRAEIGDREIEPPLDLPEACSERQIAPGVPMPSNRAAMLTPSPIRSPSLSSTTSPK